MGVDVFISFSSADRDLAERIYDRLQKFGVVPWMSSRDILPGMDYQGSIVDAIQQAKVVLLVFSSKANHSAEVVKELSLASTKLVIPARIEDVAPEGAFRYQMSNRQFYDLFDDFDRRLDGLCNHVKATITGDVTKGDGRPAGGANVAVRRARPKRVMLPWLAAGVFVLVAVGAFAWIRNGAGGAPGPGGAAVATAAGTGAPLDGTNHASTTMPTATAAIAAAPQATSVPSSPQLPASPSTGASAAARAFAAMLAPQGYDRYESIKNLQSQMPSELAAADAVLILNGTERRREEALRILATRLAGQLDGPSSASVIGDLTGFARYSAIKDLASAAKFRQGLTVAEASAILAGTESRRVDAMAVLVPYLAGNLDATDIATLLEGQSGYSRLSGIRTLAGAGLIRHGLAHTDVPVILGEIGSRQAQALQVLAPFMQ